MKETSIGLKRGTVKIVPYNSIRALIFEQEKQALQNMFGNRIFSIEHVGSTAVPGLPAKPIIDINAEITSLTDVQDFIEKLPELGYQYLPKRSYPIPEYAYRQFFIKGPESNRTHHLKLIERGSVELENSILFRDYLRTHADTREQYASLKRQLAEKYADDRDSYTESKSAFIQNIIRQARQAARNIPQ